MHINSANEFFPSSQGVSQQKSLFNGLVSTSQQPSKTARAQQRVHKGWMTINVNDYECLSHINLKYEYKKFQNKQKLTVDSADFSIENQGFNMFQAPSQDHEPNTPRDDVSEMKGSFPGTTRAGLSSHHTLSHRSTHEEAIDSLRQYLPQSTI